MQKKSNKITSNMRKVKNIKYCIQNNVQSCFIEHDYLEDSTRKRRQVYSEPPESIDSVAKSCENVNFVEHAVFEKYGSKLTKKLIIQQVENLENMVRKGNNQARDEIVKLLPLYSFFNSYQFIYRIVKNVDKYNIPNIDIQHMPDITAFLHQCILPTRYYEDDIVILMRSCIPFFQNPRRVKQDHAWPIDNDKTLIILIQCCIPSLLSIYPSICIKDISFKCRAKILIYMRSLLVGTFEQRNIFYVGNKVLIKMCFIEYIYFFINNINPLPQTKFILTIDIKNMATNIFNIGQQLRVEINSEYNSNSKILIPELLEAVKPKCLVMYERTSRYNKSIIFSGVVNSVGNSKNMIMPIQSIKMRKQNIMQILRCSIHHLSRVPYTNIFQVFDNYCQRNGVEIGHINVLWDTIQRIKVYELTLDLFEKQKRAIEEQKIPTSALHMQRQSNLLVCISCIEKNIFPKFRYDVRKNEYKCTRCDIIGSVFEVNVMGRLIVVCNIPLVFSTCCRQIVVYSGNNEEFQSTSKKCNCIKWTNHTNTASFNNLISSMSVSQYVFPVDKVISVMWTNATVEYMALRIRGDTRLNFEYLSEHLYKANTCCICSYNTSNIQKNVLLDIYTSMMLSVNVCSKHFIPDYKSNHIQSIDDYLMFLSNK